jgi:excisionase family DNA binding protein
MKMSVHKEESIEEIEVLIDIHAAGESVVETIRSRQKAMGAKDVADLLGMTRKHILKLAKEQRMPSYRLGGAVRFDPGKVADWLESRSVG